MRSLKVVVVLLAILGVSSVASASQFVENFDSYSSGSSLHGQGGWKGWDNDPTWTAYTSTEQANSVPNSAAIEGSADLVHEFDISGGGWKLSAMQYIPVGGTGQSFFLLLNQYNDGGPYDWSVQLNCDMDTGQIASDFGGGATANIVYGQWVELKFDIDLDNNTVDEYYNGTLLSSHVWDDTSNGTLECIDLFGNGASSIYYDDITVVPPPIYNTTQNRWYESIQSAIDYSNDNDEIEVAPGTYYEAINFNDKAVRLYSSGGPEVTTIDANGIAGAYHVVQCISGEGPGTILEGFTITGGNANGPDPNDRRGGGMFNYGGSPTVTNCTFNGNESSWDGGGMCNRNNSSPTVTNCTFSNNTATTGSGAGMYNYSSSPTVTGCRYFLNQTGFHGGGIYNQLCSPRVINCVFSQNIAAVHGGGMMNNDQSNPTVVNCTFGQNTAGASGGGIANSWYSNSTVTNCTFTNNTATAGGGGIYLYASSLTATNCTFSGNTAYSGGGIFNEASSPIVTDCNFSKNTAQSFAGGGMYNQTVSNPMVTNCSFTGNTAKNDGGGIYNVDSSSPTITNCIFSGNSVYYCGGGIYNLNNSSPFVTNCTFFGNSVSYDGGSYGGGMYNKNSSNPTVTNCIFWNDPNSEIRNIDSSPIFTYSDIQGGTGQVWFGTGCFDADPCFVDAGSSDFNLKTDSPCIDSGDNNAVPGDITTDLDGKPRFTNYTVDMGAYELPGVHNITQDTWYGTIQAAIDDPCTVHGDEIQVAPGTYYEAINFNQKAVRLYSSDGPAVTTINGNGAYHVVQCISGETANTILEGFTITGGDANGTEPNDRGAGMYNNNSSPAVTNCRFSGNIAAYGGAGMGNENNSNPIVTNCTFSGNTASNGGGGMGNVSSSPTVTNCNFSGNSADFGGGMYNNNSNSTVTNCTFNNNSNEGMYNFSNSSPTVTNCIFWDNIPEQIVDYDSPNSTTTISFSDVQGSWEGERNIDVDPEFFDAAGGDLRLAPGSPCIDAGNNTAVPSSVLKDLAGKLRFADDPYTPDTGNAGTTGRPVVDMGAYEFQGCGAIPQNLLANPGFETGTATGWFTNGDFSLTADTNQVHDGNYSGFASGRTAWWQGACQSLLGLMDDGKTYRISGWVKLKVADSNYVQLTVSKTDSDGTHYYGIDSATGSNDHWVHLDGTLALDVVGQLTSLYVYFEGPAADVNFYVDDAAVTEVKGDMNHNGGVDFIDFSLFASYYGFDCPAQDCGQANFNDCDNTINELDLLIFCNNWLVGTEP